MDRENGGTNLAAQRVGNLGTAHVTFQFVQRSHVLVNKLTKSTNQNDTEIPAQKRDKGEERGQENLKIMQNQTP